MRETVLQNKLKELHSKLGISLDLYSDDVVELIAQIKAAEIELKEVELVGKITAINKRDRTHRELLTEFLEVGIINRDFLTNDLKLNKTKRKQNELLYAFVDRRGGYFQNQRGGVITLTVNVGRERFELQNSWVDYEKDSKEVKLFSSIEHACEFKGILLKDLELADVKQKLANINLATQKFKEATAEYEKELRVNNSYFFEAEHFLDVYQLGIKELTSRY